MNCKLFLLIIVCCALAMTNANAQEVHNHEHEHEHAHGDELGIAIGLVPLPHEGEIKAGFHVHYIKSVGYDGFYGLGPSFEAIIDEHRHYTISLSNQFRFYKGLSFVFAPGLLFLKEDSDWEYLFAQHFEIGYEFELGGFHIGPIADLSVSPAGMHYMAGLHFAIEL